MLRDFFLLLSLVMASQVDASNNITQLQDNGIQFWAPKVFSGESTYTIGHHKGRLALQALSDQSASGLVLKQKVDLNKTPYLSWSWLVENKLLELDERSKNGDDFAARIYLVIDGGLLVWKTKSLNYVWSSNQSAGMVWNNAFAGSSVKMMSVRGTESKIGQWYQEKRNLYQDLIDVFGDKGSERANLKAYQYIDVIAIMTDTDNSKKSAESYYGDIVFSQM
jgi:hypothetical protein